MSGILQKPRAKATHVVLSGRLKFACVQDGDTMRDLVTGQARAVRRGEKWSRPAAPVKPDNPKAVGRGKWDHIKRIRDKNGAFVPAVYVQLDKGLYY